MAEGQEDKEIHMRLRSTLPLASTLALIATTAAAAVLPGSLPQPPGHPETINGVAVSSNAERLSYVSLRFYGIRPAYNAFINVSQVGAPAQQDCKEAEFAYQDDHLNRAYKALLTDLADLDKRAATQAKRAWRAFRERDCGARAGRFGSNAGPATKSTFLMESTAYRAQQLEDWHGTLARLTHRQNG
jgi:uncharacterized protein YecT (DUF1311 family)